MTDVSAADVAIYSICGKTLQELLSQLETQGHRADKAQEMAVRMAQELVRQGVVLKGGSSSDKGEAAVDAAQISQSLIDGYGVAISGLRRKRLEEVVESAVNIIQSETKSGAVVDHDGMTRAEGGAPSLKMGDEQALHAERKTRRTRQKPKGRNR